MANFDEALERMLNDQAFVEHVARDPQTALTGYDLSPDERHLLYTSVTGAQDTDRTVEQRAVRTEPIAARPDAAGGGAPTGAGSRSGFGPPSSSGGEHPSGTSGFGPPTSASGFGPESTSGFGQTPQPESSHSGDRDPDGWHDLREAERRDGE